MQHHFTIATLGHLRNTLSERQWNSIYCADDVTVLKTILKPFPNKIKYVAPYTHICALNTMTLTELSVLIQSKGSRGTHISAFTEYTPDTRAEWHDIMDRIMTVYQHTEIALRHGAKVIHTEGRVDTAYKNVNQMTEQAEFWPQSKSPK